jgi:hypothetical protein|tara:strand:+ start:399 stop:608 length:210 start_codon:yes stop_codon:yes gene_type:complete
VQENEMFTYLAQRNASPKIDKTILSAEVLLHTQIFLSKGGKITQIENGFGALIKSPNLFGSKFSINGAT